MNFWTCGGFKLYSYNIHSITGRLYPFMNMILSLVNIIGLLVAILCPGLLSANLFCLEGFEILVSLRYSCSF